jgi:GT2 family glycosyltransferase
MTPRFGCVVLTQGRRPDDLRRALDSLLGQRDVDVEVVVVGNAWEPEGLPHGVRGVGLPENRGIPAGRNAGVAETGGEILFFLDDDARLASDDALRRVAGILAAEPDVGLLQLRVKDPDGKPPARAWVPRLRSGDPARSSDVTAVWEGATAMPRGVFEEVGGWPERFFYAHEGIELAWRVMDAGHRVRYAGDVTALHPAYPPARHGFSHYLSARHRVWLARRNLPLPVGAAYVAVWLAITLARARSGRDVREVLRGYVAGLRQPCGGRRPLRWRTLWRMTRAGRPPVV